MSATSAALAHSSGDGAISWGVPATSVESGGADRTSRREIRVGAPSARAGMTTMMPEVIAHSVSPATPTVRSSPTRTRAVTTTVPLVAVIVVRPGATPVTSPSSLTLAMRSFAVDQATPRDSLAESRTVRPTAIVAVSRSRESVVAEGGTGDSAASEHAATMAVAPHERTRSASIEMGRRSRDIHTSCEGATRARRIAAVIALAAAAVPAGSRAQGAGDPASAGHRLFAAGRWADARPLLQRAVDADARDWRAQYELGRIAYLAHDPKEAERRLQAAADLAPSESAVHEWLVRAYAAEVRTAGRVRQLVLAMVAGKRGGLAGVERQLRGALDAAPP